MTPPQLNKSRKRTRVRLSDTIGTLEIERVEEVNDNDSVDEQTIRVLWNKKINLLALWQVVKAVFRNLGS